MRQIGEEFDYCYPPSVTCSKQVFTIYRYRVTGHSDVADAVLPDGTTINPRQAETIEPVDKTEYPATNWVFWLGQLRPVPPPECAKLLDAGWQALSAQHS